MARGALFPLAVVTLTIVIGVILTTDKPDGEPPRAPYKDNEQKADYFIEGFKMRYHSASGEQLATLRGRYAEHFPHSLTVEISQPVWTAKSTAGATWKGRAPSGTFHRESQVMLLEDKVKISRQADEHRAQLNIVTHDVEINTHTKEATTEAQITVTNPHGEISGIGMTLDYAADQMRLHNRARGRYELD